MTRQCVMAWQSELVVSIRKPVKALHFCHAHENADEQAMSKTALRDATASRIGSIEQEFVGQDLYISRLTRGQECHDSANTQ